MINYDGDYFEDYTEKLECQKEVTKVKECLVKLAGSGFTACSPHWCTTYYDYKTTLKMINEAVKEMRKDVHDTFTWRAYELDYARRIKEEV